MNTMEIKKIPTSMQMGMNTYIYYEKKDIYESKDGFIIDVGYSCESVIDFIEENNINVKAILLTHAHADHIGGLSTFKNKFDVPIYSYEDSMDFAKDPKKNLSSEFPGPSLSVTADKYLVDGDILEIGNTTLTVIHTPGHSPESCCFYNENTLFSGDTIFRESVGRSDFICGDGALLTKSIKEKIFTLPSDTVIYPGHGAYSTVGHEKMHNPFVY